MSKHTSAFAQSDISTSKTLAQQAQQRNTSPPIDFRWVGDNIGRGVEASTITIESHSITGWSQRMSLSEALQAIPRFDSYSRNRILSGTRACIDRLYIDDAAAVKAHLPTALVLSAHLDGLDNAGYQAAHAWLFDMRTRAVSYGGGTNISSEILVHLDQLDVAGQRDFILAVGALIAGNISNFGDMAQIESWHPAAEVALQALPAHQQEAVDFEVLASAGAAQ